MFSAVLSLAVLLPGAGGETLKAGTQLTLRGGVAEVRRDRPAAQPGKTFDLTLLVTESDDSGLQLCWLVDEHGSGAWPWLERFGRWSLDAGGKGVGTQGPALLYDYGTGKTPIALLAPLFVPEKPLTDGATWEQDGLNYEVEGAKEVSDRDTWELSVQNSLGAKRTLWVEKDSPLVVGYNERVFMDKGTEYQLQSRLVGVEQLSDADFQKAKQGFSTLLALRGKLKRPARSQNEELTADERAMLSAQVAELEKTITTGVLAKLVRSANRELQVQAGRADALAKLSSEYVGQPVSKFSVAGLGSDKLSDADLRDAITVLHFWDYRDEPLKEPYGQVGYLEFLHNRRKNDGVKIYGVAVDSRLQNPQTAKSAQASIRKLKNFMNLTYPVLLDDGALLKQFGDPRLLGAALPLVVVIGGDGSIVHYHVGFYPVDRQDGLKELDALIAEMLKKE